MKTSCTKLSTKNIWNNQEEGEILRIKQSGSEMHEELSMMMMMIPKLRKSHSEKVTIILVVFEKCTFRILNI